MTKGYQDKLGTYIKKDDFVPIESTDFLKEVELNGILDEIVLPDKVGKFPSKAHLSFVVYMNIKKFSIIHTIGELHKNPDLAIKLGYDLQFLPNSETIKYFIQSVLTHDGLRELMGMIDSFRYDKSFFITDTNTLQPLKKDNPFSFTVSEKKRLVRYCFNYILEYANIDMKKNSTYNSKVLFQTIIWFLSEASTANGFSEVFRNDPLYGRKMRQKAPTGKTILNFLRKIFKERINVEEFFDFLMEKIMVLLRQKAPELFNHRYFDLAFDYTSVPTYENQDLYYQAKLFPDKYRRGHYAYSKDIIEDSHITGKGTISFRKFLCCSIVINGFRFCVSVMPVTHDTNKQQALIMNKMLDRMRTFIPTNFVRKIYADRGFDSQATQLLLQKRGVNYVMGLTKRKGKLANRISKVTKDVEVFRFKLTNDVKITVIVLTGKYKNKYFTKNGDIIPYDEETKKFVFCTNLNVNVDQAKELVKGYRSRWSIETMFRDKNKLYGKTTSNNSMIRDFYFSYTMTLFNMWILCNIILYVMWMHKDPGEPKIRLTTFRNYVRFEDFNPPPDEEIEE
jgi:hypothetical protein